MEPTGQLFDKPMTELREAFVRARFAQEDVFGRPDIEQWLAKQRKAERPECGDESYWNRVLVRDLFGTTRPEHVLRSHASPYRGPLDPRRTHKFGGSWASIAPLMSVIMNVSMDPDSEPFSSVGVYYGHRLGGIIVVHHMGTRFSRGANFLYAVGVSGEPSSDACLPIIQPFERNSLRANIHVLDVLFAEWLYERERRGPARQFLCDALAEEIARERAKAEHDFDTAVAVSADGTKIVHADWVVVVPKSLPHPCSERWVPRSTMTVFPGAAFHERKILKSNKGLRLEPHYDPCSHRITSAEEAGRAAAEQFAIVMRYPEPSQAFGYLDKGVGAKGFQDSCLITTANFCPSPLPEGGIEVTV